MKRNSFAMVIASLLLVFCLIGCGHSGSTLDAATSRGEDNGILEEENISEPPHQLIFDTVEAYASFVSSVTLEDSRFEAYINEHDYSMNGILSKDDVENVGSLMEEIPFPHNPELELAQMIIYPEDNRVFFLYRADGEQSCTFLFEQDGTDPSERFAAAIEGLETFEMDADRYAGVEKLVCVPTSESTSYFAVIRDHFVLIRAYGFTCDSFEDTLCGFEYGQILE